MENFPTLQDNQVALLRAEFETGHILDESHNLVIDDFQKAYTIFSDVDAALLAAQRIIKENKNIECIIYDKNKAVLHYLTVGNT